MRFGRRPYHRLPHSGRTAAGRRRRSLAKRLARARAAVGILPDGQVCAPCSGASCEGRDYRTLVRQFRDAGFENLSLIAEDTGFDGAAVFDGCVLFVSIDGDKAFSNETVFAPDAAVEIHYAVKSEDESAASSGASAESSAAAANADEMVWIPQSGAKYHTRADCGNMIAPRQVTQSEAERLGYTPCRRCH